MSSFRCSSRTSGTRNPFDHALLVPAEMARADQLTIADGTPGVRLMEAAGQAVAEQICERWSVRPVAVLCGPGNNGGDGFVVARLLRDQGWPVRLGLFGHMSDLRGDAQHHAALWPGDVESVSEVLLDDAELVVDGLFGTGLSRPLDAEISQIVDRLNDSDKAVCAIDIPSGIDGNTGRALGQAVYADLTVTFFRKKTGQLLLPGRQHCGDLVLMDIGIPDTVLSRVNIAAHENHPDMWLDRFSWPQYEQHKYTRGHVLIRGGDLMTGAARLSALSAARAGAGLVSVAASPASWPIYAATLTNVMVLPCDGLQVWQSLLSDARRNVALIGPGLGVSIRTRDEVLATLEIAPTAVLDADALTAFADQGQVLFQAVRGPCVMTPHSGEFIRIFGAGNDDSKLEQTRQAARVSGAVIVHKGADTIIAAPDGRAIINTNAPPDLATGGTGDVLAGIIAGFAAQGMEVFDAAAAAVWIHGRAAALFGPGLIADDLPSILPRILRELKHN